VLAYAATAVPATMNGGGVLYEHQDPREVARLMGAVLDDHALQDRILSAQDSALARLRAQDFAGTLLRFVEEVLRGPRRPAHQVAWDFWAQYESAERLEELRMYRPAAFKALPPEPPGPKAASPRPQAPGPRPKASAR
jgi:hypothetical protein